jgi:protein-L-isoaspartate O-methyltransferase
VPNLGVRSKESACHNAPTSTRPRRHWLDIGYDNVHVLHGDGTKGWSEHAPYDAIVVAAGGPQVPESPKEQLKVGGRLVIPVGADQPASSWFGSPVFRKANIAAKIFRIFTSFH